MLIILHSQRPYSIFIAWKIPNFQVWLHCHPVLNEEGQAGRQAGRVHLELGKSYQEQTAPNNTAAGSLGHTKPVAIMGRQTMEAEMVEAWNFIDSALRNDPVPETR